MTRWDWTWEERSQANRTPTVEPNPATDEHEPTCAKTMVARSGP